MSSKKMGYMLHIKRSLIELLSKIRNNYWIPIPTKFVNNYNLLRLSY
jgi:hypothetical protein